MIRTRSLRLPFATAAALGVTLWIAGPAAAHIDPVPAQVEAGAKATVGFTVEHGCGTSPTTKVEIQLPDGSSGIAGVDAGGFTSSVAGQVVTFTGGPLDAETEQEFSVSFTAPSEAGEVPVKIIQTCETGSLEWIEVTPEGGPEPEHPAPILTITAGKTTQTTEGDHHAEEPTKTTETTEGDHHAEEPAKSTETTEGDHHAEETDGDSGSGSSAPVIIGVVAAIAVLGGGGLLYARSRKPGASSTAPDAGPSDTPDAPADPSA